MNAVMNKVRECAENEKNEFKDIKIYEATQKVQIEINKRNLEEQLKKFEGKSVMIDLVGEFSILLCTDELFIREFKDIKGNYRFELMSGEEEERSIFIDVEDVYLIYKNRLDDGLSIFSKSGTELEITLNE
mgnify:CR=1 FL=1